MRQKETPCHEQENVTLEDTKFELFPLVRNSALQLCVQVVILCTVKNCVMEL